MVTPMPLSAAVLSADSVVRAPEARAFPWLQPDPAAAAARADDGWDEPADVPFERVPLRCRLGLHRWLPLALSLHGSRSASTFSFCRRCPAVRRPQPRLRIAA